MPSRPEAKPSRAGAAGGTVRGGIHTAWRPALAGFLLMLAPGALSLLMHEPLLFPSLGPTALIQAQAPRSDAAKPWNTLMGHAVGVAAAVLALAVTGAGRLPAPIATGVLTWQRELASALAVALTIGGQIPLRAVHPPAAATTLLITLGAINPEWRAVAIIAAGVALITALGEPARRWLAPGMPSR